MKMLKVAVLLGAVVVAAPLSAQEHGHAAGDEHEGAPPYITAIANDLAFAERKIIALAEAIPEEDWTWRPGEGVRSVGEVFQHIAADNYFMPAMVGVDAPAETGIRGDDYETAVAYETRSMNRAETLAALRASFDHLRGALDDVDHDDLHAMHSFFGNEMSGMEVWIVTATHVHEHLGQSIAYARSNGIVPPWSR